MEYDHPIAYFLDIESCPLPIHKDPVDCLQLLREQFGSQRNEMDFIIACDVTRHERELIESLEYTPLVSSIVSMF